MKIYLRTSYDDHDELNNETGLQCNDPSLAQQHQKDETDINLIVRRFTQTGELPQHNMPPLAEDFQGVESMQEAMQLIVDAKDAFMEQPAEVRAKFNNDAALFVEFCSNEKNTPQMEELGLLSQEAVERLTQDRQKAAEKANQDRIDAEAYRSAQKAQK